MVRMTDVAEEANVSVATVSRVLSGDEQRAVRPETATLVREAAERLGYRYNQVAASLRTQHTHMYAIVVPRIGNPFFSMLIEEIERRLSEHDIELIIADSREDPELEAERITALANRQVDGIIIVPAAGEASNAAIRGSGVPTVQLDLRDAGPMVDRVGVDHAGAIRAAARHLLDRGHTRIAFVGADTASDPFSGRLDGYLDVVPAELRSEVLLDSFSMEWGYEAAGRLAAADHPPTAVICANDLTAYGVLKWAHEHAVSVPDDLAVTGFDDLPFSSVTAPPLTTIRQPVESLAETAVELLRSRVSDEGTEAREITLRGELVVRGSS